MKHVQVRLTLGQHARLGRWARHLGISVAAAIRRCVDATLAAETERAERIRAALSVVGKYRDSEGRSRVGRDHDRALAVDF